MRQEGILLDLLKRCIVDEQDRAAAPARLLARLLHRRADVLPDAGEHR